MQWLRPARRCYGVEVAERAELQVTALNADVVGYSRLMADSHEATAEQMAHAREVVAQVVQSHSGHLVNFVGDNFMAVFDQGLDGVRSAIDIASAMEGTNAALPKSRWLRFRMGMEQGPITVTDANYEGDALNVAARLQALAPTGGLAVSGAVYLDLDEPALRFRSAGSRRLKNIPEPVAVYEYVGLPSTGPEEVASRLALDTPTLAVLPLHTRGVDAELAERVSVIRDDVLYRLAAIPGLRVIDAASSQAAPDTGAGHMLECGVHQVGQHVRVHATLFDTGTMNVVKAFKETGNPQDVFDLSDSLAERVGRTVEVELVVGAPARIYSEQLDPVASQHVYMGWYHLRNFTRAGLSEALAHFEQVTARHPSLPYGWALSAFANWVVASSGWATDPAETLRTAWSQAGTAVEAGDPTGMAQAVQAAVLMSRGKVSEAVARCEGLQSIRPTCDVTYGLLGSLDRYLGKWRDSVEQLDLAMQLTAVNKPWYPTVKSCSLLLGERPEQAAALAESVLDYQPRNLEALLVLASAQVELGLHRRAAATAESIRDQFADLDLAGWLASQPYQDAGAVQHWGDNLATLGLVEAKLEDEAHEAAVHAD